MSHIHETIDVLQGVLGVIVRLCLNCEGIYSLYNDDGRQEQHRWAMRDFTVAAVCSVAVQVCRKGQLVPLYSPLLMRPGLIPAGPVAFALSHHSQS